MSYKKIPQPSCETIWARVEISEAAEPHVDVASSPKETVDLLVKEQCQLDVVNFFSHALPMRECIWWACLALELRGEDWSELERSTLELCKVWVLEPEEAKRRFIEQRLTQLGHACAVGWLAQAVIWNGSGSIVAADLPQVFPAPYLYAKAVAGAVNTAATKPEWSGHVAFYDKTLAIAEDIASGGKGSI